MWSCLLSDPSFVKSFVEKNQAKLGSHYRIVTDALRSYGIGFETEWWARPRTHPPPLFFSFPLTSLGILADVVK
jgi:hypothetical protein